LFRQLELHWPPCLLLYDSCSGRCLSSVRDILHPKSDEIAAAQLTVDGEIEQSQVSWTVGQLQTDPDGPDLRQLERALWTNESPLIPRDVVCGCN
jgi:hypothetical protein